MVKALDLKSNGNSRAGSNPARSDRSHFSEIYSGEVGNTNQYLCSQATETDEPKILNYFSWKGHVGDSVWKRPPRQSSAKNRRLAQAKNCPRTESDSIKKKINVKKSYDSSVVKALDLQPNGNFPRTLEPCSQPSISFFRNITRKSWEHEPILVFASNWDWRTKDSQLLFLERTSSRHRLETTTTTILSKKSNNNASKN